MSDNHMSSKINSSIIIQANKEHFEYRKSHPIQKKKQKRKYHIKWVEITK